MGYLDFELEIGDGVGTAYPVEVVHSPAGEARQTMQFPYDEAALENHLQALELALLRGGSGRRRLVGPEERSVQDFGRDLFDAVFAGEIKTLFDMSRHEAASADKGLRVKLRFESSALASLPWEFLYDSTRAEYLCLSNDTPIVRYLELSEPIETLAVAPPLRILGMVASPTDLDALDIDRERGRIDQALQPLVRKGAVELGWVQAGTWRQLQHELRVGQWHVFHFTGHGGFDPATGEGVVALADESGASHLVSALDLGRLLGDHHPLRLAVLNSCDGARGDRLDVFSSTAATLVRRGTPAVVAMQFEITDKAAIELARAFYDAVADGTPVDTALTDARKAVCAGLAGTFEWGTPVLYMRAPDGALFDVATPQPPTSEVTPVGVAESTSAPVSEPELAIAAVAPGTAPPSRRRPSMRVMVAVGALAALVGAVILALALSTGGTTGRRSQSPPPARPNVPMGASVPTTAASATTVPGPVAAASYDRGKAAGRRDACAGVDLNSVQATADDQYNIGYLTGYADGQSGGC